jgi:rubrerythrin
MATTYQLLQKAEQLELLAGQLYQALAGRHAGPARDLFERLAGEEVQHAARIRLLAARYRQDPRLFSAAVTDGAQLDALLVEAAALIEAVRAGQWDGDPAESLRRAADLERRYAVAHAQVLTQEAVPGLRAFFEQLAAQDRAHLELLRG